MLFYLYVLGQHDTLHFLLSFSIISVVGFILSIVFLPESPVYSLIVKNDESSASETLKKLRRLTDVRNELEEIKIENNQTSFKLISFNQIFSKQKYAQPLIICIALQVCQQLTGINEVIYFQKLN